MNNICQTRVPCRSLLKLIWVQTISLSYQFYFSISCLILSTYLALALISAIMSCTLFGSLLFIFFSIIRCYFKIQSDYSESVRILVSQVASNLSSCIFFYSFIGGETIGFIQLVFLMVLASIFLCSMSFDSFLI